MDEELAVLLVELMMDDELAGMDVLLLGTADDGTEVLDTEALLFLNLTRM